MNYAIKPLEGFTEKIGELAFMLEHSRSVTLNDVKELQTSELDFIEEAGGNSIGALLAHIAAIEKVHQLISFEDRDFTEEEWQQWGAAIELGNEARSEFKGRTLTDYLTGLEKLRSATLDKLRAKEDSWLYEERYWPNGVPYNNYYLWFHVMEDEISHRGQIRAIKRRLRKG